MSDSGKPATTLPAGITHSLAALERRILTAFLLFGGGRTAAALCGLLLALYGLDRGFEPPAPARLVLLLLALAAASAVAWRYLLLPLRHRPEQRDLAAIWERNVPALEGRLSTAVELLPRQLDGGCAGLLAEVARQADEQTRELDPRRVVPMGRARRSLSGGAGALALLILLASFFPGESGIFLRRLLGAEVPWPHRTHLVLLAPYAEGREDPPALEEVAAEVYRLQVARGTVLILRARAEGVVPSQVLASSRAWQRAMRPLGDGGFVLRLPPLQEAQEIRFQGGDDDDGRPFLRIEPGIAPAVVDWRVRVTPPAYTGAQAEESAANEYRVARGSRLEASFRTDRPVSGVLLRGLEGEEEVLEAPDGTGRWSFGLVADRNGERLVELRGEDGFADPRAAVLRWNVLPDTPPDLDFVLPEGTWTAVPGGRVPILVEARDDYGLAAVLLTSGAEGQPEEVPEARGLRRWRRFLLWTAPPLPPEGEGEGMRRLRLDAWARDAAEPESAEVHASSAWIEVVPPEEAGRRLEEALGRVRERVERLRDRVGTLVAGLEGGPAGGSAAEIHHRVLRDLEGVEGRLEGLLLERIFTGLDPGAEAAGAALAPRLEAGAPGPGEVVAALDDAGALPLETAGTLLGLARLAGELRHGAGEELAAALADGTDPLPAARRLLAGLDGLLEALLAWEDFQSAVRMLRELLEQQRNLHLRTREAADG